MAPLFPHSEWLEGDNLKTDVMGFSSGLRSISLNQHQFDVLSSESIHVGQFEKQNLYFY